MRAEGRRGEGKRPVATRSSSCSPASHRPTGKSTEGFAMGTWAWVRCSWRQGCDGCLRGGGQQPGGGSAANLEQRSSAPGLGGTDPGKARPHGASRPRGRWLTASPAVLAKDEEGQSWSCRGGAERGRPLGLAPPSGSPTAPCLCIPRPPSQTPWRRLLTLLGLKEGAPPCMGRDLSAEGQRGRSSGWGRTGGK